MPTWTPEQLRDYERKALSKKFTTDLRAPFYDDVPGIEEKRRKLNALETDTRLPDAKPRERSQPLAGNISREAQGAGCPVVRFTLSRVQLLDVDAKYGSVKDLLDGLTNAGLIHGDKEGQISLEVQQVRVPHYADEKTEVEIWYEEFREKVKGLK